MKTLTLTCCKCGKTQKITAESVDKIIVKIDAVGWGGKDDICPRCEKVVKP